MKKFQPSSQTASRFLLQFVVLVVCWAFVYTAPAYAVIRYVKTTATGLGDGSSWANASADLQAVINASAAGDSVWVAAGTYKPTDYPTGCSGCSTTRDYTFHVKDGVKIYGGFSASNPESTLAARNIPANPTTLSGDIGTVGNASDNAYHVVLASAPSSGGIGVTIDGFTITGGNANVNNIITVSGNTTFRNSGGGIYTVNGTNTLSNNTVSGNSAVSIGGGIATFGGTNTLANNTISGNTATSNGGGFHTSSDTNALSNNTISSNTANIGGGIYTTGSINTLSNNTIWGNSATVDGGGIYTRSGTNTLSNNTISGNSANYGGGFYTFSGSSNNTLRNNVFSGNTANTEGGGMYSSNSENRLSNNTFGGNTANIGGGILIAGGTNTIGNNIFWDNKIGTNAATQGADYFRYSGANTFTNNLLQLPSSSYTTTGSGNYDLGTGAADNLFAQNPMFVNAANPAGPDGIHRTADDGLRLQAGSPPINTGIASLGSPNIVPATDILGTARPQGSGVDMGAYETSCSFLAPTINNISATPATICPGGSSNLAVNGGIFTGGAISIPFFGNAAPYPSTIAVSGLVGNITNLKVTISNLSHSFPVDIDMVLFGPTGAHSVIFTDAILGFGLSGITYTFQIGATPLPQFGLPPSGTYGVATYGNGYSGSGTPSAVTNTNLGIFNGTNPNGAWSLYVFDDLSGDTGTIGSWSIEITTGNLSDTYAWSPATYLNNPAIANPTASGVLATTTYTVTVTSSAGCTSTASQTITVSAPTPGITGTATGCGSVTLTATGGTSYAWSGGSTPNQATNTFTTSNTYTVTVTSAEGCTATASQAVTVNPLPTAGITGTATGCGSVTLTASGGTSYVWSGGSTPNQATNTFTTSNTYTVTVTSSNGCTATATQVVTVNPLPSAGITGTATGCGSVTLTASGGTSYAWSGGSTPNQAQNTFTTSNTYTVTVTSAEGCTATASQAVTVNAIPTPNITNHTSATVLACNTTTSISVTATGGSNYAWSGGDTPTTADNTFTEAGEYTVTVTSAEGCTATASINITGTILCPDCTGTLGGHALPGTPCNDNNPNTANDVYDANCNCAGTPILCNLGATLNGNTNLCAGSVIGLVATGGNQYQWSGPGGFTQPNGGTLTRTNATPAMSGTYTVTITNNTCVDVLSIDIIVHPIPSAILSGATPVCSGGTISLEAPAGAAAYQWSGPGGFTQNTGAANTLTRTNATTLMGGLYRVTVTNAGGCTASGSRNVSVSAPTVATVTGSTTVCANSTVNLTATTVGVAYQWAGPGGFAATTAAISAPPVAGTYTVTVTSASGCISTASRTVTVSAAPTATISGNTTVCVGGTIYLVASGGNSYAWSGPGGYSMTGTVVNRKPATTAMGGVYTVTVTGNGGCTATASVMVTITTCKLDSESETPVLLNAYPNPTADETTIVFTTRVADEVSLSVYAIDGREVAVLYEGATVANEINMLTFNANQLAPGAYFVVLRRALGSTQQIRLVVAR